MNHNLPSTVFTMQALSAAMYDPRFAQSERQVIFIQLQRLANAELAILERPNFLSEYASFLKCPDYGA